jgi:hypothetical protein
MAFADPQSVTISGSAKTLARVPSGKETTIGKFSGDDGNTTLTVHQNSTNARFRREFRLTQRKVAADPITAVNKELSASIILSVDEPNYGFTDADLLGLFTALKDHVTASTNAKLVQLLNGEL